MQAEFEPVEAKPHTSPYKIHKYFARRPWNVFRELIKSFTKEDDLILDPFCGGGVTIYEGLRLNRKVIGCDLNPLSIFIVDNMVKKPENYEELEKAYQDCQSYLDYLYSDYLEIVKDDKNELSEYNTEIEWFEVAFQTVCPVCGTEFLMSNENKIGHGKYSCSNKDCNSHTEKDLHSKNLERLGYKYIEKVYYDSDRNQIRSEFTKKDYSRYLEHIDFLEKEVKKEGLKIEKNKIPLDWDRQYEDYLEAKNIIYFEDLFTKRNLLILVLLLNKIKTIGQKKVSEYNYELLRLVFSNLVKDTNIMSFTSSGWQSGRPVTWSKHAYWVPSQFCEVNMKNYFSNAFNRIKRSLKFNAKQEYKINKGNSFKDIKGGSNLLLFNKSLDQVDTKNESIDVIITDPPYGSNVQYLELSHFWYVWNKDLYDTEPDFNQEAVSNRKSGFDGAKDLYDYEQNLYKVFVRSHKLLKPEGRLIMTFNNKNINAWLALLISVFRAGFSHQKGGIYFQDGVENYKQTAHTKFDGSPYGDFIYVFNKKGKSNYEGRQINDQDEFLEMLKSKLESKITNGDGKSVASIKIDMIEEVLPLIEAYVKNNLNSNHSIYEQFSKNLLKKIYN